VIRRAYDALVFGGGSAGMAAAARIASAGFRVAVLEREAELGGVLNQCIHSGFGLQVFREDLTGPEYAERFCQRLAAAPGVEVYLETTAQEVGPPHAGPAPASAGSAPPASAGLTVYGYSHRHGVLELAARAGVLAMGCRERNRGNVGIPGTRPAGVLTAGFAQRLLNVDGYLPGRRAVIVGSGDIGLIMARRLTWAGARVLGVVEIQPYPSGLTRNVVQCLNDFGIPLYLSHVVSRILGADRVQGVEVSPLAGGLPQAEKSFRLDCDTVLLSVGLRCRRAWGWSSTSSPAARGSPRRWRPASPGSSPAATCCTCTTWWTTSRRSPSAAASASASTCPEAARRSSTA